MDNLDHTVDVQDTARKTSQEKQGQLEELPEGAAESEFELFERITFGGLRDKKDFEEINKITPTGYLTENELSAIRKLQSTLNRIRMIQNKTGLNNYFQDLFDYYLSIIHFIIQSSKSRDGFANKNLTTERHYQNQNVNQLLPDQAVRSEEKGLADHLKSILSRMPDKSEQLAESSRPGMGRGSDIYPGNKRKRNEVTWR